MKKAGYFKKAIKDFCKGDYAKQIDLPHLDPGLFATYLETVYVSNILPEKFDSTDTNICTTLCRIYVIAEEMVDPATKNVVIRELDRVLRYHSGGVYPFPTNRDIEIIYQGTGSSENKGRQYLVSRWMSGLKPEDIESQLSTLPRWFIHEVARKLLEKYASFYHYLDSVEGFIEEEDIV
jgi:hypothetical protein